MAETTVMLDRLLCHAKTEWHHDEVYDTASGVRHTPGGQILLDTATLLGPEASQGATSGTPRGDQTAWETDDSGGESDLQLGASLFPVSVARDEHVVVTLTFREGDGDS